MSLHVNILENSYKLLNSQNPAFSLNSFARFLSLSPSQLNEVLSGKCGLSPEKALKITKKLPISKGDSDLFVLSAKASHSRRKADRLSAKKELDALLNSDTYQITNESFNLIANWYNMAVLELTAFKDFSFTSKWISKTLKITDRQAKESIQCMKTLNLFKKIKGKFIRQEGFIESVHDTPNSAIKNYHIQMLNKAKVSLEKDDVKLREFNSGMFCINENDYEMLKTDVREFMQNTIKKYSNRRNEKTELVALSAQMFPVTQIKKPVE